MYKTKGTTNTHTYRLVRWHNRSSSYTKIYFWFNHKTAQITNIRNAMCWERSFAERSNSFFKYFQLCDWQKPAASNYCLNKAFFSFQCKYAIIARAPKCLSHACFASHTQTFTQLIRLGNYTTCEETEKERNTNENTLMFCSHVVVGATKRFGPAKIDRRFSILLNFLIRNAKQANVFTTLK